MTTLRTKGKVPQKKSPVKPTVRAARRKKTDQPEVGTHSLMHQEHRQWLSDAVMWQDDMVQWQADVRRVLLEFRQLQTLLEEHGQALTAHAEKIIDFRQSLSAHEHAIANYEQGAVGDELIAGSRGHRRESEEHAEQQKSHEVFKRRHWTIISQWDHLRKAIADLPRVP